MSAVRRLPSQDPRVARGNYNVRLIDPEAQNVRGLLWRGAPWGLAANLGNTREADYMLMGINTAIYGQRALSPRRGSSGKTDELAYQPGGRKWRKEHYTRKARMENFKEKVRRLKWQAAYPNAPEHHWEHLEEQRRARKKEERETRKAARRKSSNKK